MLRTAILAGLLSLFISPAWATPKAYKFDYGASKIEFIYKFNGEAVKGKFPKFTGDLVLDFENIRNSVIDVSIDTKSAQGGFIFATSALRGPKVLNAAKFPAIIFKSQSAKMINGVAKILGKVTVRGVTRPLTLTARFFNLNGKDPDERDELAVRISGAINRHEFGASGYPKMVGDTLSVEIIAQIKRK